MWGYLRDSGVHPSDPFVMPLIPAEWFEVEEERRQRRAARRCKGGSAQPGMREMRRVNAERLLSGCCAAPTVARRSVRMSNPPG